MSTRLEHGIERARPALVALAVAVSTWHAWANRFIQDDAFISFRYARNLSDGFGLTFNPGERVEGYTNFLWTVWMALPFRLGIDPVHFATAVGLLLHPVGLLLVYYIAVRVVGSSWGGLLAVVLLGTNYTFSAFATGGLETQLHVVLLLAATSLAISPGQAGRMRPRTAVSLSLCAAAALLTRMDSAVYLGVVYAFVLYELYGSGARDVGSFIRFGRLAILPGALCVILWLGWRWSYYGEFVPNTYYVKMIPLSDSWYIGLRYLWTFVWSYWLLPVLALCAVLCVPIARAWDRRAGLMACLVVVWCGYVIRVGGDFMEFRLLVPMLPCAFVLLSWILVRAAGRIWLTAVVGAAVIAGSQSHARSFEFVNFVESVRVLQAHVEDPSQAWATTGKVLGDLFGSLPDPPRIATTASGAVPFYSNLPTTDMLGLTDPWTARYGLQADPRRVSPGHSRTAPFHHLVDEGVNLVVGKPWVTERFLDEVPRFGRRRLRGFGTRPPRKGEVPPNAAMQVLEIPLSARYRVYVLYLIQHDGVDRIIREQGIHVHPVAIPDVKRSRR